MHIYIDYIYIYTYHMYIFDGQRVLLSACRDGLMCFFVEAFKAGRLTSKKDQVKDRFCIAITMSLFLFDFFVWECFAFFHAVVHIET